jgi:hypothetical protein
MASNGVENKDKDRLEELRRERVTIVDGAQEINQSLERFEQKYMREVIGEAKFENSTGEMERKISELEVGNKKSLDNLQRAVSQSDDFLQSLTAADQDDDDSPEVILTPDDFNRGMENQLVETSRRLKRIFTQVKSG